MDFKPQESSIDFIHAMYAAMVSHLGITVDKEELIAEFAEGMESINSQMGLEQVSVIKKLSAKEEFILMADYALNLWRIKTAEELPPIQDDNFLTVEGAAVIPLNKQFCNELFSRFLGLLTLEAVAKDDTVLGIPSFHVQNGVMLFSYFGQKTTEDEKCAKQAKGIFGEAVRGLNFISDSPSKYMN